MRGEEGPAALRVTVPYNYRHTMRGSLPRQTMTHSRMQASPAPSPYIPRPSAAPRARRQGFSSHQHTWRKSRGRKGGERREDEWNGKGAVGKRKMRIMKDEGYITEDIR